VGRAPDEVARFLASTLGLAKAAIGEYLGGDDAYDVRVMHAFVDQLNFTGLAFVDALRLFLQVRMRVYMCTGVCVLVPVCVRTGE
jgi:brefeldin A-inhibited guanine nucleotide-exchange protein